MPWYFVLGGDGLIGRGLFRELAQRQQRVLKTSRRVVDDPVTLPLDLKNPLAIFEIPFFSSALAKEPPVAVIAAAMTGFAACRQDPTGTSWINVDATVQLAEELLARGSFVVYLSSNAVFRGDQLAPNEEDPPDPETEYGRQKLAAEQQLVGFTDDKPNGGGVAIVRLTKVLSVHSPLVSGWLSSLSSDKEIDAFEDLVISPISLRFSVAALIKVAEHRATGIYHLSGGQDISYYEFAKMLASKCSTENRVRKKKGYSELLNTGVPLPRTGVLAMRRTTEALGLRPQPIEDVVEDLGLGTKL